MPTASSHLPPAHESPPIRILDTVTKPLARPKPSRHLTHPGKATFNRSAVFTSRSQLPSSIGIPFRRRSASVRHSGSPATITSS